MRSTLPGACSFNTGLLVAGVVLLLACDVSRNLGVVQPRDATTSDTSTADTSSRLHPTILRVDTSQTELLPDRTVEFTATVVASSEQPVASVLLEEEASGRLLATFVQQSSDAYVATLEWEALRRSIDVNFASALPLGLRVVATDSAGETARRDVALSASCGGGPACHGQCGQALCADGVCIQSGTDHPPFGVCAGECVDFSAAENCGSCGNTCGTARCVDTHDRPTDPSVYECECGIGTCNQDQACMVLWNGVRGCVNSEVTLEEYPQLQSWPVCVGSGELVAACGLAGPQPTPRLGAVASVETGYTAECGNAATLQECIFHQLATCEVRPVYCDTLNFSCVPAPDDDTVYLHNSGDWAGVWRPRALTPMFTCADIQRGWQGIVVAGRSGMHRLTADARIVVATECNGAIVGCSPNSTDVHFTAGVRYLVIIEETTANAVAFRVRVTGS